MEPLVQHEQPLSRANGLDDFILSMVPVPERRVISSVEVYRPWAALW
jgi:hypothetical protein